MPRKTGCCADATQKMDRQKASNEADNRIFTGYLGLVVRTGSDSNRTRVTNLDTIICRSQISDSRISNFRSQISDSQISNLRPQSQILNFRSQVLNLRSQIPGQQHVPGEPDLRSEASAYQQIREAWIGSKRFEYRIDLEIHQPDVAFFLSFVQPLKGLVFFAEAGIDGSDGIG